MINGQNPAGIYIHVPFCRKKCQYCDFCSVAASSEPMRAAYVVRLCDELARTSPTAHGRRFDTVYFGGGTPTLLTAQQLCDILAAVRQYYTVEADAEITLECNPATVDGDALHTLRRGGFNRLSIGMQSANDAELCALGRIHRHADVLRTVDAARAAGFDNLSLDLMYGIPGQTQDSFAKTLQQAIALAPEHLSAYSLIIEPGTPFYDRRDTLPLPDEDALCAMTEQLLTTLRGAGYERYEISNFSRPGKESRHNLHYWSMDDYLGFGPAAHALWCGTRTGHSRDIAAYLDGADITEPEEVLNRDAERDEYVMLRLRLARGIDKAAYRARFDEPFDARYAARLAPYLAAGYARSDADTVALTDRGMDISNHILSELLF